MTLELTTAEQAVLRKIIQSYRSDLRQAIAATKRGTGGMHEEEGVLDALLVKVGEAA